MKEDIIATSSGKNDSNMMSDMFVTMVREMSVVHVFSFDKILCTLINLTPFNMSAYLYSAFLLDWDLFNRRHVYTVPTMSRKAKKTTLTVVRGRRRRRRRRRNQLVAMN